VDAFLKSGPVIDWEHPDVLARARSLRDGCCDDISAARRCFEWVRDEVRHSQDYGLSVVTCTASEVLRERSGYCYAKSHLLAALLRANGIPTGFCYQRLSVNDQGTVHCLHGLNAVFLSAVGWYRIDPRGNRPGIHARFDPPVERLAFTAALRGEADLPEIWAEPLDVVVNALRAHTSAESLGNNLPDVTLWTV